MEFEYAVNEYTDFEYNPLEDDAADSHEKHDSDSDFDDDLELSKAKTDTSAMEFRNGKDMQGIPWERLIHTREEYRKSRIQLYKNYENLSRPRHDLVKECKEVEGGHSYFDFQFNTQLVKSTIVHFQLRNLLSATSKHDVYLMQNYSLMHWSSLLRRGKEVMNAIRPIVPSQKSGSMAQTLSRVQISAMTVKDNLMVAGGFQGELICKYLDQPDVAFCTKITTEDNAITNAVDVYHSPNGQVRVMAANNDAQVRIFDVDTFVRISQFSFPWSVNNTSVSPDGRLLAVLGDSEECLIADAQSGKVVSTLKGHLDYSFSSAWHPDGRILATGNQDTTCRIWDIRNLSSSVSILKGRMGAIRAIRFSSDGRFLAMAEPADFIHIFDTRADYAQAQEIDLFGEIAGVCFSPDTEALFIGVADRTYGSLLEFNRKRYNAYLECMF